MTTARRAGRAVAVAAAFGAACATERTIDPRMFVHEAEETARLSSSASVTRDACFCASRGFAVKLGVAARGPLQLDVGGDAAIDDAGAPARTLWLRASSKGGATLAVARDQGGRADVVIEDTRHRDRFEWLAVLELAATDRRLEIGWQAGADVELDQWAVLPHGAQPDERASPRVVRQGDGLELRAGDRAAIFDPAWVVHLLREQRDAVLALLGAKLQGLLVLVALPADRWPLPDAGAFENGCVIYLRDDELHLPWRSFAHEITHVAEDELPCRLPTFLSEGIARAVAREVEAKLYVVDASKTRPREDDVGADRWVGLVQEARGRGGAGFWPRLWARLEGEPPGTMTDERAAQILELAAAQ